MPKPISTPRTIPIILVLLLLLELLFTIVGLNSAIIKRNNFTSHEMQFQVGHYHEKTVSTIRSTQK
jgi:hypothetical protein